MNPGGSIVANDARPGRKKRPGCLLLSLALLMLWAAVGWALWIAALNAPMPEKAEEGARFELIPSAEGS